MGDTCYLAVRPPLNDYHLSYVPKPHMLYDGNDQEVDFLSRDLVDEGDYHVLVMDSFTFDLGGVEVGQVTYAQRVAEHLGSCSLDPTVYSVDASAIFKQS